jgi:hypothetical protein
MYTCVPQAFAVDLYRIMWRALMQWPEQRSTTAIVNLWLAYVAPCWAGPNIGAKADSLCCTTKSFGQIFKDNSVLQAFAVDLYRFMWRALTQWPEQRSTAAIVNLWLAYAAPWWAGPNIGAEPGSPWRAGPSPAGQQAEGLAKQLSHMSDLVQSALGESHTTAAARCASRVLVTWAACG